MEALEEQTNPAAIVLPALDVLLKLENSLRDDADVFPRLKALGGAVMVNVGKRLKCLGAAKREALGVPRQSSLKMSIRLEEEFIECASLRKSEWDALRKHTLTQIEALKRAAESEKGVEGGVIPDLNIWQLWDDAHYPSRAFTDLLVAIQARVALLLSNFPAILCAQRSNLLRSIMQLVSRNTHVQKLANALFDTVTVFAWSGELRNEVLDILVEVFVGMEFRQLESHVLVLIQPSAGGKAAHMEMRVAAAGAAFLQLQTTHGTLPPAGGGGGQG